MLAMYRLNGGNQILGDGKYITHVCSSVAYPKGKRCILLANDALEDTTGGHDERWKSL